MDWLQIGSAALMVGMLVIMYPRMKHAVKNSPKGTSDDWKGVVVPLVGVIAFVVFLMSTI